MASETDVDSTVEFENVLFNTTSPHPISPLVTNPSPLKQSSLTTPQLQFKEVEDDFHKTYIGDDQNNSAILDMIAVYLKGQKLLYTEAKTLCELRLNYLMLPAIFNTAVCTILGLVLKEFSYGPTIVSSLNGINAFLLAVISYLKLDARAEAHRTSAYKFDKIQSGLVFSSGRVLFGSLDKSKIIELIDKTEKEVQEIKESNQFVLPEKIRFTLPTLYNTNIFAEVKTIMNKNTMELNILKDLSNDRQLAFEEISNLKKTGAKKEDIFEARANYLLLTTQFREKLKQCINMRNSYQDLDDKMDKEIKILSIRRRYDLCSFLKN
jgi:hypothetical protein